MPENKIMNRNYVIIGSVIIQLCLGAIYAWSVFTPALTVNQPHELFAIYSSNHLEIDQETDQMVQTIDKKISKIEASLKLMDSKESREKDRLNAQITALEKELNDLATMHIPEKERETLLYGFSKTQTSLIFSAGLALFAVVMVLAGRMMPGLGPQKLAVAGGIVLGLGYLLAGLLGGTSFWIMFFCVGIIGGAGIGLAYVVPIAVGMRWFPDKKGLITGLAVAGFGFGALLWVKLAGDWGGLIMNLGLNTTFTIYGIAFLLAVLIGSIWMKFPPEGWQPAGWKPTEKQKKVESEGFQMDSLQMLGTSQFYMILLTFTFGASAGLMTIGLMKLFPMQALEAAGFSKLAASSIAGTAMAVFFSLANGLGRIAWGAISDKLGRKTSLVINMLSQGIFVICFQWIAHSPILLYLGAVLIGFNYGGCFSLFPSITAETFGAKYIGQNYGWVFLAYGIGGIFGPVLGGKLGDMGNFPLAFIICGGLCLAAAAIVSRVSPPQTAR